MAGNHHRIYKTTPLHPHSLKEGEGEVCNNN
jgi:hypothetical protein